MATTLDHLNRLYGDTDDPWNFIDSPYEQQKFCATKDALTRGHYRAALELGCGNGALAQHIAPLCQSYVGVDAVERPLRAARNRVPDARFIIGCYPCPLPDADFDLIILSEVLYFLTPETIAHLCRDLTARAPRAEIICTTFLGDTELPLQGAEALQLFSSGMQDLLRLEHIVDAGQYRIDRGTMRQVL